MKKGKRDKAGLTAAKRPIGPKMLLNDRRGKGRKVASKKATNLPLVPRESERSIYREAYDLAQTEGPSKRVAWSAIVVGTCRSPLTMRAATTPPSRTASDTAQGFCNDV
jgi:hypothetical protein